MKTDSSGLRLKKGDVLQDDAGDTRWEAFEPLASGRSFDLWLVDDRHLEGVRAVAKMIRYPQGSDEVVIAARRALFDEERELYVLPQTMLPEPLDWLVLSGEPVLVYEHQSGETLESLLATRFTSGLGEARALRLVRELAHLVAELHAAGVVLRDLSPAHIVLGLDDTLQVIGLGNAARIGAAREGDVHKTSRTDTFSAPEASHPGASAHPSADVYSLGVLLLHIAGGSASARLSAPLADIAARCTAPAAKRPSAQEVFELLRKTTLPRAVAAPAPATATAPSSAPRKAAPPESHAPEKEKEKPRAPEKKPEVKRAGLGAVFWVTVAVLALGGIGAAIYFFKIKGG